MKTKYQFIFGALAFCLVMTTATTLSAAQDSRPEAIKKVLSKVPPPELPAKAAELVSQAQTKEQRSMAVAVVRAAVKKNPVGAPFVVNAVARAVPTVAAVAAATA